MASSSTRKCRAPKVASSRRCARRWTLGSKPLDVSPDGVLDMGGNVMEMTLPLSDPTGQTVGPAMKGGHWSDDLHPEYALTFARYAVERDHEDAGSGFRCVKAALR